jgi:hypothetical protein
MKEIMKYDYWVARRKRKWETEKICVLKRLFLWYMLVVAGE